MDGQEKNTMDMNGSVAETEKDKLFSQEDLDKVISERLKRERAKWDKDLQEKVANARKEAEKLSMLSAEEKTAALMKAQEEALKQREQDLLHRELRNEAVEALRSGGMPVSLAACVNLSDRDSLNASVQVLGEAFRTAVDEGVNKRLVSQPPKAVKTNDDPFLQGFAQGE